MNWVGKNIFLPSIRRKNLPETKGSTAKPKIDANKEGAKCIYSKG